jgi:alpha-tubulin suppressor-like RCC1 family protein
LAAAIPRAGDALSAKHIRPTPFWRCLGLLMVLLTCATMKAQALTATYTTGAEVPVVSGGFTATGQTVAFTLNYAPTPGTRLMVVNNTSLSFINGTFSNLAQGQAVTLSYAGVSYDFVADYYGGTGNDLVLHWKHTRLFGWGLNDLGTNVGVFGAPPGQNEYRPVPRPMDSLGVLEGKTVIRVATGAYHCLALCSDGTLATWGWNYHGQLGDNSTFSRNTPVAVNRVSGVSALYGKTVVGIAAGGYHCLALCSDGTVVGWGNDSYGALGNGSGGSSMVPVAVSTTLITSALYNKTVVSISAAGSHSVALCSDSTVVQWGFGLGAVQVQEPVLVNADAGVSALHGRTPVAIAANAAGGFVVCTDGAVAAWGQNGQGLLGDNSTTERAVPVLVNRDAGVSALYGKTVTSMKPGASHALALCSDGTVVAWGYNGLLNSNTPDGMIGDGTYTQRNAPVLVSTAAGVSALNGKTVVSIMAGGASSQALCSDGTAAGWGGSKYNGTDGGPDALVPKMVGMSQLAPGERFIEMFSGSDSLMSFAVVASAPEMAVEQPVGTALANGGSRAFGTVVVGGNASLEFTIKNTGAYDLTGLTITKDGANAGDFTVTASPVAPVSGPSGSTTFTVRFAPTSAGAKTAALHIDSNDADERPYHITLTGSGVSGLAASYTTGAEVPVVSSGFTATGQAVAFTLNYAPVPGTRLLVVNNVGLGFIGGTFSNLTQGQAVTLTYAGVSYDFVADYYGGTGNDLVLHWKHVRVFGWGVMDDGLFWVPYLPNGHRYVPTPMPDLGVLAGKTVVRLAVGAAHCLALCSDGTLASWGWNVHGQLGDNSNVTRYSPVAVNRVSGVSALYGKTVVGIAAGYYHSLALCSDGTVAGWGYDNSGALGNGTGGSSWVPVAVNTTLGTSALNNKTVVSISAANSHCVALCSDSTVVQWGNGLEVPVLVNADSGVSALHGRTPVTIAANGAGGFVVCSDGAVAAWGQNAQGQLGDNSTTERTVPVLVNRGNGISALYGKTVMSVKSGGQHTLALCSDGTLVAWGYNGNINFSVGSGMVGDGTYTQRNAPVLVSTGTGVSVLNGKAVVGLSAGDQFSHALCSDGTAAGWGSNDGGKLGSNTGGYANPFPLSVSTTPFAPGERFIELFSSPISRSTFALVAAVPDIAVEQPVGTGLVDGSGSVGYGSVPMAPGVTKSFTIRNAGNADLTGIAITKDGAQSGDFVVDVTGMSTTLLAGASTSFTVRFTPGAIGARAAALHIASNDLDEAVFDINLTGTGTALSLAAIYTTGAVVPLTTATLTATGSTVGFTLNHTPVTGATLMVVKMTGLDFIQGTFSNLAQGQMVTLSYGGSFYPFVADYYGGTGNDLVLRWANTKAWGWGENGSSQMGDGGTISDRPLPTPASVTGLLAGKTILALAPGPSHCVALCSDGTVAVWGSDSGGRLGRGPLLSSSSTPVTVDTTGVLAGKRVISISSGLAHSLAICSDGALVAWGRNFDGELGIGGPSLVPLDPNGNPTYADVESPVLVNTAGQLAGKTVVVLQASYAHSLALCTDGTLYAWGHGGSGRLGSGTNNIDSPTPAAVSTSGALAGKTVVMVAGGGEHNLALCSDGTLVAWGEGGQGRLGTGNETDSYVPVNITNQGVLSGRTVVAISAGMQHSLALCSDGTVAAWGVNDNGQLGNNSAVFSPPLLPVAINSFGALAGKTVVNITAGHSHSVAYCSDGSVVTWGNNASGQLGDGTVVQRLVPVLVSTSTLPAGHRFIAGFTSQRAEHCVGLVAGPATTPVQDWRQQYFGTLYNSGSAADSFDYDNDGLVNLLEWACGLNPTTGSTLPITNVRNGANLEFTYTRSVAALNAGAIFTVEWSDTLPGTSWSTIGVTQAILSDNGTVQQVKATLPAGSAGQRFVRLKVTGVP